MGLSHDIWGAALLGFVITEAANAVLWLAIRSRKWWVKNRPAPLVLEQLADPTDPVYVFVRDFDTSAMKLPAYDAHSGRRASLRTLAPCGATLSPRLWPISSMCFGSRAEAVASKWWK